MNEQFPHTEVVFSTNYADMASSKHVIAVTKKGVVVRSSESTEVDEVNILIPWHNVESFTWHEDDGRFPWELFDA